MTNHNDLDLELVRLHLGFANLFNVNISSYGQSPRFKNLYQQLVEHLHRLVQ